MNDQNERLAWHSCGEGVEVSERRRDDARSDILELFSIIDVVLFHRFLIIKELTPFNYEAVISNI